MKTLIHEMRNQLAVATANIEAVAEGKLKATEERMKAVLQALSIIDALINHLPKLADVSLSVERGDHADRFSICRLIALTVEGLQIRAERKGITLKVTPCELPQEECHEFIADSMLVGQVISNVVLNAIAYTSPGGSILINCHRENEKVILVVADTGAGLTNEDISRIFEPGYRGAASIGTNGSGLGLTFVKAYLESHGGSICARRLAQGTEFTLELRADVK